MHPNAQLIERFYRGFAALDPAPMVAAYAPYATFSDPAFPDLKGPQVSAMWTMLCARAKDFSLTFRDVQADDERGSAHWEADYRFGGKRRVHNVIDASFVFERGLITQHVDRFDFSVWARQALGPAGLLLGWTGFLRHQVQSQARAGLAEFMAAN
jgi:hypothetical protein